MKGTSPGLGVGTTTNPSRRTAHGAGAESLSIHRVETQNAEGAQTDPAFAPLPTAVNLFLSRSSCNMEPEIWKNLTPSRFRHRKTLFKANAGIPPSSSRNVEPAGLRSAASQKSHRYAARLGAVAQEGQEGLWSCFLTETMVKAGRSARGASPRLGKHGQCCPQPPAAELATSLLDPACVQRPCPVPELGRGSGGKVPLETEGGSGCSGIFHFLGRWRAVKGALFLEEERRLCVPGEGAVPLTRRRVCSMGCGHQCSPRLD